MMMKYVFLSIAIGAEVIATLSLKASQGFTRPTASLVTLIGYGVAFYALSLTLKYLPTGLVYALWSGIGIVLISVASYYLFGQKLDLPGIIGMGLICAGVLVINLFSKAVA